MSAHDIVDFIQIDDRTATSGQPTRAQFERLRGDGYAVVINLAPDGLATSLGDEAEVLRALGFTYHHIPVPWTAPSLDQLDAFTTVMDRSQEQRVLVHCQANMRVTAFYSLYAMARLGWDEARAQSLRDEIWTKRPGFTMDDTWRSFIVAATNRIAQAD